MQATCYSLGVSTRTQSSGATSAPAIRAFLARSSRLSCSTAPLYRLHSPSQPLELRFYARQNLLEPRQPPPYRPVALPEVEHERADLRNGSISSAAHLTGGQRRTRLVQDKGGGRPCAGRDKRPARLSSLLLEDTRRNLEVAERVERHAPELGPAVTAPAAQRHKGGQTQ